MILRTRSAFYVNAPPMAFDELLCDKKADARANGISRREKGIEDSVEVLFLDPCTCVSNGDKHTTDTISLRVLGRETERTS